MELTADNVQAVVRDCLYRTADLDDERRPPEDAVMVQGVTATFGFHPKRLEGHRADVLDLLGQLPDSFRKDKGGGMSFLQMCNTHDGQQWTGLHRSMEDLLLLGIGLGLAGFCAPKALWPMLPGGMPYVWISADGGPHE